MRFLSIQELRRLPGLRIVIVQGAPSPWGQAAKAMIEYKGLPYSAGLQIPRGDNEELLEWAGTNSGPVVAWNDDKPINAWLDILNLLERLEPTRPLLRRDPAERAEIVGLANEICGELGLGWNRRLSLYQPAIVSGEAPDALVKMGRKYGYNQADVEARVPRQVATLELLTQRILTQHARGSDFFVGDAVTALDFYWAAFSLIFDLPSSDLVPVAVERRPMFEHVEPEVRAALVPELMAHRDRILREHFRLPMQF